MRKGRVFAFVFIIIVEMSEEREDTFFYRTGDVLEQEEWGILELMKGFGY